jgi:SNF2 family DNA or RNA helicase
MEMQAISRAVRLGQTEVVAVNVPYIVGTVDDRHKFKHKSKSEQSVLVTGDTQIDAMYFDHLAEMEGFEQDFLVDLTQDD